MTSTSQFATIRGLKIHYTSQGSGSPLVLLHGGIGGSAMFAHVIGALAAHRQVIAVDLESHGHTADLSRPLRYEAMAEDIAGLISDLGLTKVDVLGYSLGGGVATRLAIQHPALVGRLVLISTAWKRAAFFPEVIAAFDHIGPDTGKFMSQSPLAKIYPERDWSVLFGKVGELQRRDYDWTGEIREIRAQILLVYADADAIRPTHEVECYALLGGGQQDAGLDGAGRPSAQMAILPGVTHYSVLSSPVLPPVVSGFLDSTAAGR